MPIPKRIEDVFAPVVTGVPPSNAFRNLIQLPDGTLRCYGFTGTVSHPHPVYLQSDDHGLTWRQRSLSPEHILTDQWTVDEVIAPFPGVRSPYSDDHYFLWSGPGVPLSVYRSTSGIDGPYTATVVDHRSAGMMRLPMFLAHRPRVIVPTGIRCDDGVSRPAVVISDDDGHTWRVREVNTIHTYPVQWPHRGVRWQNRVTEPTVVELSDGTLWMMLRTSTDHHYECFSHDGGETWTDPAPSKFYGTITMPTLHRLNDGRILLLWCNTTPLPERDHHRLDDDDPRKKPVLAGSAEDVFTNRDAFHAAISEDDGKTWRGFRELLLNEARNEGDFATSHGGTGVSLDKSVHQSQALCLPSGKVLVAVGQHPACRRLLVFDPEWLYETTRRDDFSQGLDQWSVHQYIDEIRGHCAYDRRIGPGIVDHPHHHQRRVMHISRQPRPELVSDVQGAVWNFPAALSGQLRCRMMLNAASAGARVNLMDRWFNPTNTTARHFATYTVAFSGTDKGGAGKPHKPVVSGGRDGELVVHLSPGRWHDITFRWWDARRHGCQLTVGDVTVELPLVAPSEFGVSYVHFLSVDDRYDAAGYNVEYVEANAPASSGLHLVSDR